MIKEFSSVNLDAELQNGAVVLDFWAPWCTNCRMMTPFVEKMATELDGQVNVIKVNSDENMDLAKQYDVQTLPTLICFKGGAETKRLVGPKPYLKLLNEVKEIL